MIENPISLHEIRDKAVKGHYANGDEFLADFELMYKNAQTYNEVESIVAHDAVKIYEFVSDQIHEYEGEQQHGDDKGEDSTADYLEKLKVAESQVVDELINYKTKGRKLSLIFMDEPSEEEYPEYYRVIKNASSFNTVRKQINNNEAPTILAFFELVDLIFKNAKLFNEEGSQVYSDADTLQSVFHDKVDRLRKTLGEGPGENQGSIKLKVKPLHQTTLKLNLKGHSEDDSHPVRAAGRRAMHGTKSKIAVKDETDRSNARKGDSLIEATDGEDGGDDDNEDDNDDDDDDDEVDDDDNYDDNKGLDSVNEDDDEGSNIKDEVDMLSPPPEIAVPPNIITRSSKNSESLFQMVNVTSNIPVTSRYMQAKNPVPPANFLDVFQLIIPPSKNLIVRAYSFTLPTFHSTLNFSIDLHPSLHFRHYNLSLIHQGRRLNPASSTSSNPFSDNAMPLKDRFELTLIPGLNHIELILQASPRRDPNGPPVRHSVHTPEILNSEGSQVERLTFWVCLTR